jgi:hypothetical protein
MFKFTYRSVAIETPVDPVSADPAKQCGGANVSKPL